MGGEIVMLNEVSQVQNITCSDSFVKPAPKVVVVVVIMGHECERGMVWGINKRVERERKIY
jgi:hypothetical protein